MTIVTISDVQADRLILAIEHIRDYAREIADAVQQQANLYGAELRRACMHPAEARELDRDAPATMGARPVYRCRQCGATIEASV